MSRHKTQTEMVTFRAPAGTKRDLDVRARAEGYKDRSALILAAVGSGRLPAALIGDCRILIGSIPDEADLLRSLIKRIEREYRDEVSQETALSERAGGNKEGVRTAEPSPELDRSLPEHSESADEGKDKLERAHETMAKVAADRPLLTHAHAVNCPCSICTKSG